MCKVYHVIGCLTAIKSHLQVHQVNDFRSVQELIRFKQHYASFRQNIIDAHKLLIEQEKKTLDEAIVQLNDAIINTQRNVEQKFQQELEQLQQERSNLPDPSNVLLVYVYYFKKTVLWIKIQYVALVFKHKITSSVVEFSAMLSPKKIRYDYIVSSFADAVIESSLFELKELERKNEIIDELKPIIYGALGEQKVVKELENLSDDYILINDFTFTFDPPLYNNKEKHIIKSIQIDHLLVTPSGIFLIETKNWSEKSLQDSSLRSPVQQIQRTSFALYHLLSRKKNTSHLILNKHHWGEKKIPVKNVIVLINHKPNETFNFIKILTLNELLRYVTYFEPCFSNIEVATIAEYLLHLTTTRSQTKTFV